MLEALYRPTPPEFQESAFTTNWATENLLKADLQYFVEITNVSGSRERLATISASCKNDQLQEERITLWEVAVQCSEVTCTDEELKAELLVLLTSNYNQREESKEFCVTQVSMPTSEALTQEVEISEEAVYDSLGYIVVNRNTEGIATVISELEKHAKTDIFNIVTIPMDGSAFGTINDVGLAKPLDEMLNTLPKSIKDRLSDYPIVVCREGGDEIVLYAAVPQEEVEAFKQKFNTALCEIYNDTFSDPKQSEALALATEYVKLKKAVKLTFLKTEENHTSLESKTTHTSLEKLIEDIYTMSGLEIPQGSCALLEAKKLCLKYLHSLSTDSEQQDPSFEKYIREKISQLFFREKDLHRISTADGDEVRGQAKDRIGKIYAQIKELTEKKIQELLEFKMTNKGVLSLLGAALYADSDSKFRETVDKQKITSPGTFDYYIGVVPYNNDKDTFGASVLDATNKAEHMVDLLKRAKPISDDSIDTVLEKANSSPCSVKIRSKCADLASLLGRLTTISGHQLQAGFSPLEIKEQILELARTSNPKFPLLPRDSTVFKLSSSERREELAEDEFNSASFTLKKHSANVTIKLSLASFGTYNSALGHMRADDMFKIFIDEASNAFRVFDLKITGGGSLELQFKLQADSPDNLNTAKKSIETRLSRFERDIMKKLYFHNSNFNGGGVALFTNAVLRELLANARVPCGTGIPETPKGFGSIVSKLEFEDFT
jgi:hypothetical protein